MKKYDKRGMVLTNDYVQNILFVCVIYLLHLGHFKFGVDDFFVGVKDGQSGLIYSSGDVFFDPF